VTTGPPLYVVSACGSAEEFVAAFRRYADRTGLFIPLASPLPAGRRGRIALTLKDGGVMIEGEAEIIQSSVRPTVLHGRPGMTVKFVEPDEPSKVVISELEKARLAMKPSAPSVAPRYAAVPTQPRPTPPTPTGRIDAANALAECIVIGDASSLQDTRAIAPNDKSGSKLAVPGIPSAPRSKMPSAPPPVDKPRNNMTSVGFPALGLPPRKPDPSLTTTQPGIAAPANPTAPTAAQNPVLETKPARVEPAPPRVEPPPKVEAHEEATTLGTMPPKKATDPTIQSPPIDPALVIDDEATTFGSIPKKRSTDPMPAVAPPAPSPAPPPTPPPAAPAAVTRHESSKNHKATSIGFPAIRGPAFETQARGISVVTAVPREGSDSTPQPPTLPKSPAGRSAPPPRGKSPTTPPLTPRHPTPVAPVPIVRPPAKSAPQMADEEKTELRADVPAVITSPLPVDDSGKLMPPPTQRSGGMRASEILAAIPAGDWTMTPDESIPNPLPPEAKVPALPVVAEPTPAPAEPPGPPTGNWTISLDPQTQSWSEPEKLPKGAAPTKGNPVVAVASEEPISVVRWDDKPTGIGESKIEIDSDLMKASPSAEDAGPPPTTKSSVALDATAPQAAIPHGDTMPPPVAPAAPPRQRQLPYPSVDLRPYQSQPVAIIAPTGKRKKMIAMAIGAVAIAIGAIVVLVMTLSGQDKPGAQAKQENEGATVTVPPKPKDDPSGDPKGSQQAVVEPSAGSETPKPNEPKPDEPKPDEPKPDEPKPAATPPVATGTCTVQLASTPNGAEIYIGRKKSGTTPTKLELPCGVETKVSLRKAKFANTLKAFTPQADKPNKLMYKLKRDIVSVKVTSTPPGATITFGGKSVGVTPTTIKLPQFDTSTITLTKPGYSAEKARVTPKQNNAAQHVTLKRGR
jgi:hypothetical protein